MTEDRFAQRYYLAREWWPKRHERTLNNPKLRYDQLFERQWGVNLASYAELAKAENHAERVRKWRRGKT